MISTTPSGRSRSVSSQARDFIDAHRNWNQGAGLVVPPCLARELRKMGIEDGYTERKPLREAPNKKGHPNDQ